MQIIEHAKHVENCAVILQQSMEDYAAARLKPDQVSRNELWDIMASAQAHCFGAFFQAVRADMDQDTWRTFVNDVVRLMITIAMKETPL